MCDRSQRADMREKEEFSDIMDILIQAAKSQDIEDFDANPNEEENYGDGFAAQFYTGNIQNKDTDEIISVAIKKAPSWGYDYSSMFKNEYVFYSLIFPALNDLQKESGASQPFDNVPKYFCGGMNPRREYIVMENLKPLSYVMFDKREYLYKEHLELIFKTYGKFHALSYVLRKKYKEKYETISKNLTNVISPVAEYTEKQMVVAVSATVNALDLEKDKMLYDEIHDFGTNVVQTFKNASTYTGQHRCLVHGDCWSNNMLFKYSELGNLLDIKLIDFQFCQENTPVRDLSFFFYSGAARSDMDDLDNYLKIYYRSFLEYGKELGASPDEIFSFDVLKNEWKENALFGVIFGIYLWQVKLISKKDISHIAETTKEQKLSKEEIAKLWETLLNSVHNTYSYKERTTAILRHAFEYGVINKNKIVRN